MYLLLVSFTLTLQFSSSVHGHLIIVKSPQFTVKYIISGPSKHIRMHLHCSLTSVGVAQARPNHWKDQKCIQTHFHNQHIILFHVLSSKVTHVANQSRLPTTSLSHDDHWNVTSVCVCMCVCMCV